MFKYFDFRYGVSISRIINKYSELCSTESEAQLRIFIFIQDTMVFYLITKFGAIEIKKWVTCIGRKDCDIRLHFFSCSHRHGSIILRPDGTISLINHSMDEPIFINKIELDLRQGISLKDGDVVSFSGDHFFKKNEILLFLVLLRMSNF